MPDKPIWITEWGVLDRPHDPAPDIAEYALSMLNYIDKWYADRVATMVWYAWVEDMDNGYSLVDNAQNPRPILYQEYTSFLTKRIKIDDIPKTPEPD